MGIFDKLFKKQQSSIPISKRKEIKSDLVVLIIMDGLGIHPDIEGNSVMQAQTPFLDTIWTKADSTLLNASGTHVGLPSEEPGNSEVGHLNIGSGQVVYQSLPRINDSIRTGRLDKNPTISRMFEVLAERKSKLHLMGIMSAGGVHGHIEHLFYLLDMCHKYKVSPYIHAFLDGRDTAMTDGYFYISRLMQKLKDIGVGELASISGRFYAMDRDKRWERTQLAYDAIIGKGGRVATDPFSAIQDAYKNGENDQIFIPTTIVSTTGEAIGPVSNNDIVFFYNFREDRARQITKAFVLKDLDNMERKTHPENLYFVTMTGYEEGLPVEVVFAPKKVEGTISASLSDKGLSQLHISETEKYMHVTYFFNGGVEKAHPGEEFFNIPSPKVFDYSETPEMSAEIIRDEVLYRLGRFDKKKYSFILINFANPDMLGHTGNLEAAIKAVSFTDKCVGDILAKTVAIGGVGIVIADHGNCETMVDRVTKKPDTAHNPNPVPFILVSNKSQLQKRSSDIILRLGTGDRAYASGILADVAPTILNVLGIEPPVNMTGINLLDVL